MKFAHTVFIAVLCASYSQVGGLVPSFPRKRTPVTPRQATVVDSADDAAPPQPTRRSISQFSSDFLPNQGQAAPPQKLNHQLKKDFIPNMAVEAAAFGKKWGIGVGTTTEPKAEATVGGVAISKPSFKVADAISADEKTAEKLRALYDEYLKKVKEEGAAATEGKPLFRVPPANPRAGLNGNLAPPTPASAIENPKAAPEAPGSIKNHESFEPNQPNQGQVPPPQKVN